MSIETRLSGRRVWPRSRYIAASLFLHLVLIAVAALFVARPPDEPIAIEVSIILDSGDSLAGGSGASGAEDPSEQQASPQAESAPRPSAKPAAAPRKTAPRASAAKAAPAPRQVSQAAADSPPVVQQPPAAQTAAASWTNPDHAPSASASVSASAAAAAQRSAAPASGVGAGAGTAAGAGSGSGAGSAAGGGRAGRGANDYLERVRQALAKHKRYPEQARKLKQEGTARISLVLARDGTVLSAQIANGSGFPLLDEATLQMARDASPVPRVPDDIDGESVKIALPVTFSIGFFGRF